MEFIKKNKKFIIIGALVLIVLVASIIIYNKTNNDGMNNKNIYNIKYRVYQNGKWSKYSKNGMTVGDKKNPIQNLEFKYNKEKGLIFYNAYGKDWSDQQFEAMSKNIENIYGIEINTSDLLYKKYDICYRTYNSKDKWLNWACNNEISGNKEEPITAIEVKLIPKKIIKFDYLKDFNKTLETKKGF